MSVRFLLPLKPAELLHSRSRCCWHVNEQMVLRCREKGIRRHVALCAEDGFIMAPKHMAGSSDVDVQDSTLLPLC